MQTQRNRNDLHDGALRVLKGVRDLLEDRRRWAYGAIATDEEGRSVHAIDPRAVRWCAAGAILKVAEQEARSARASRAEIEMGATRMLASAIRRVSNAPFQPDLPRVNDGPKGYERIMAGLDEVVGGNPKAKLKRWAAALKGWDTRRKRAFDLRYQAWLREQEAASVDPRPEAMAFGGTITAQPQRKEDALTLA